MFDTEIKQLERAMSILGEVEARYEDSASKIVSSPDRDVVQAAFHCATHEAATVIGLSLQDIRTLVQRLRIRDAHSSFTAPQFQFIVENPWSTNMVAELFKMLGDNHEFTLATLSPVVKEIQQQWNALRRLSASYGFPNARRTT